MLQHLIVRPVLMYQHGHSRHYLQYVDEEAVTNKHVHEVLSVDWSSRGEASDNKDEANDKQARDRSNKVIYSEN